MTDPALDGVVVTLLTGSGIALAVVLVMLGIGRLVRRRPVVAPAEPPAVEESPALEPVANEGTEMEVPAPRDPAQVPAAEVVAAEPGPRKILA